MVIWNERKSKPELSVNFDLIDWQWEGKQKDKRKNLSAIRIAHY